MSQWVRAWEFCEKYKTIVPDILRRTAWRHAGPILNKRARPKSKPAIRFPRGKDPKVEKKRLHAECEALCKALVFHRDCGDWCSREGKCITCEVYTTLQWGHFLKRQKAPGLLYSVQATGGQCGGCNGPGDGEPLKYSDAIAKRDGEGEAGRLVAKFYKKPWTWNKTTLTAERDKLIRACQEKGLPVDQILAKYAAPKAPSEASEEVP